MIWNLIPAAEIVAALIASIGALFGMRLSEKGLFATFFERWTASNVVTFEGGKVEFLDTRKSPGDISAQLESYLQYEELVRSALQNALRETVLAIYERNRCDFYVQRGEEKIGIEAKNSFKRVSSDHIRTLASDQVRHLLLVSEEPFDKQFMDRISSEDFYKKLRFISASDAVSLESAIREAVDGA